jgi:hypothetical protein
MEEKKLPPELAQMLKIPGRQITTNRLRGLIDLVLGLLGVVRERYTGWRLLFLSERSRGSQSSLIHRGFLRLRVDGMLGITQLKVTSPPNLRIIPPIRHRWLV